MPDGGLEAELDIKVRIGGMDGPGQKVPGFPSPNVLPGIDPTAAAPAPQAEQPRKSFRDGMSEYTPGCPKGQEQSKQAAMER